MGRKPDPGWPPVYGYEIRQTYGTQPGARGLPVVELNGDLLSAGRSESNGGGIGSCQGIGWLDSNYIFHELIAYWLGFKEQDMTWEPEQHFGVKWAGKAAYQQRVGEIVESEREKLRATVEALQQRGFLTADEAAIVTPKIVVTIECDLKPCPLK